jgi:crotonobetainyl-CoA:carnitine CoA-transferase CaiB-like acyl-CoA transferase
VSSYDFLKSVVVVEVAQLGMDALGGYLADMGARVIKVEALPNGDPIRFAGDYAVGSGSGPGFLHLRWNRGKQSVGLDLRTPEGTSLFKQLASKANIVIEGLKGGSLDRLGLGYEVLRKDNPALIFCSLSGLGRDGPYHKLRSHAVAYDVFAGLMPKNEGSIVPGQGNFKPPSIGMHAPGLYAAIGVLAALHRARHDGLGTMIEVAAADAAADWLPDGIDPVVNAKQCQTRDGFLDSTGRMLHWPRLAQYATSDGRTLLLEALSWPTWRKFCKLLSREDLLALHESGLGHDRYHAVLHSEIADIIARQTLDHWMTEFSANDISAMPVNDFHELARDPHYVARHNWYEVEVPGIGTLTLTGTPIRLPGTAFSPELAPGLGQHTDQILEEFARLDADEVSKLRQQGIIT